MQCKKNGKTTKCCCKNALACNSLTADIWKRQQTSIFINEWRWLLLLLCKRTPSHLHMSIHMYICIYRLLTCECLNKQYELQCTFPFSLPSPSYLCNTHTHKFITRASYTTVFAVIACLPFTIKTAQCCRNKVGNGHCSSLLQIARTLHVAH